MAKRKPVYEMLWRNKFLTLEAKSISNMADILEAAANNLRAMAKDGIKLDPHGGTEDDYARLITTDAAVAKKHGLAVEDYD